MTLLDVEVAAKPFTPGTTGWTAADLDDPAIESEWFAGRYEIVEGVLSVLPPAYYSVGACSFRLASLIELYLRATSRVGGGIAAAVEIVTGKRRVVRADVAYLTAEDQSAHDRAARAAGRPDPRRTRVLVPPLLIIVSISPGHEAHDRQTKRRWYAEFGVRHYWLLDVFERSLDCLVLDGDDYRTDVAGRGHGVIRPSTFPGLSVPLTDVWRE